MIVKESLRIGDYVILQDDEKYRFTSDSILLARFLKAKRHERVADFCSGSGIVGLHFYAENEGVESVTLFEMQPDAAELSGRTVALNKLESVFRVENVRIQDIPKEYVEAFSLILCNPPYGHGGVPSPDAARAVCTEEQTLSLSELIGAAARCLKFGGRFALSYRSDRVSELLCALTERGLEPKRLQFVAGKRGAKPYLVLVSAVKGGKRGVEVLPELTNTVL